MVRGAQGRRDRRGRRRSSARASGRRSATGCGRTRTSTATWRAPTAARSPRPQAAARRLTPAVARQAFPEFAASRRDRALPDRRRALHAPELGELVEAGAGLERTILTNAMIFGAAGDGETLEAMDRSVVLQVSLDSATAELHDRQRGAGSWARALDGIGLAQVAGVPGPGRGHLVRRGPGRRRGAAPSTRRRRHRGWRTG